VNKAVEQDNNVTDENEAASDVLYKYYAFNQYTEKIFTHNEIYFAEPKEFNDPFDSKVGLSYDGTEEQWKGFLFDWCRRNKAELSPEQRIYFVNHLLKGRHNIPDSLGRSFLDQMGVYCMSAKNNDILMWSHYSNGHSGFCLEFDANNEFFGRSQKMNYQKEYPNVNFFTSSQWEKTKAMLLTKAKRWHYERECRIIDHDEGPGIKHFPAEFLTGVILGCRISAENRENIFRWCSKRKQPPILYEAREKQKEFGLDIVRLDY